MCWKRHKPPVIDPVVYSDRVALLFGINNYPGSGNDLSGCINDIYDVEAKLNKDFPGFQIRKFKDSEVTIERFKTEISNVIVGMPVGTTVVIFLDSCFSTGATKANPDPRRKIRFHNPELPPREQVKVKIFRKEESALKWLVFSGCGERQTSADAYFNNRPNGAFTYSALDAMDSAENYAQLIDEIEKLLPSPEFEQAPELEGPSELRVKPLFLGPTLIIWYSGHGTYDYDQNGDEADGYDEALYLFDGMLLDDDINAILQKIVLGTN